MINSDRATLVDILNLEQAIDKGTFSEVADYVRDKLGMENVVYFSPSLKGFSYVHPYCEMTYKPEWEQRYREAGYIYIDPVFKRGNEAVIPVDWLAIPRKDKVINRFFNEAEEYGVGRQGITIPVRFPNSPIGALFTLTNNMNDKEWLSHKKHIMKDAMLFAHYFHARIYDRYNNTHPPDKFNLTRREQEVISWVAEGRTVEDVGQILNLSKDTVKAHLESVRHKTNALNTTHAVTILYRNGFL